MKTLGTKNRLFGMACVPLDAMNKGHLIDLADLDAVVSLKPWTAQKFKQELTNPLMEAHGVIAPLDRSLIAFALVRKGDLAATITDIIVRPDYRRIGVGSMLIQCVRKSCLDDATKFLEAVVSDARTEVHFFLKKNGFRAVEMLPVQDGHAYVFRITKETGDSE